VIEIGFGYRFHASRDDDKNSISREVNFQCKRYWLAQKIDGHWISADWDVTTWPDARKKPVTEIGDRLARSQKFTELDSYDRHTSQTVVLKNLKLPHTKKREDRDETPTYYIPHDESLWAALRELAGRIDTLQDKIIELLGSTEHRNRLAASMQNLLPESTKDAGKEK